MTRHFIRYSLHAGLTAAVKRKAETGTAIRGDKTRSNQFNGKEGGREGKGEQGKKGKIRGNRRGRRE